MKYLFSFGIIIGLFFSPTANALLELTAEQKNLAAEFENIQAIEIKTSTIAPLAVSFFGPGEAYKLEGLIAAGRPVKGVRQLELKIETPSGGIIASDLIRSEGLWEDAFDQYQFDLSLPFSGVPSGSVLKATVISGGRVLASGEKAVPIFSNEIRFDLEDLEVSHDKKIGHASFAFSNYNLQPQVVFPRLKVRHSNFAKEDLVVPLKSFVVSPKSQKKLSYEFPFLGEPGAYEVSLGVFDERERLLSGKLSKKIVVKGDFAAVSGVDLQSFELSDDYNYKLLISGVSDKVYDELTLKIRGGQIGESVDRLINKSFSFSSKTNSFYGEIPLLLKNKTSNVAGEIIVTSGELVLAKKKFDFSIDYASVLERSPRGVSAVRGVFEEEGGLSYLLMALLGLIFLVAVLFLVFFFKRKRSKTLLVLLLAFSFLGAVAQAQSLKNFWYHPLPGWAYNPSASGVFSNFKLARFHGAIFNELTQEGFFQSSPSRVVIRFYRDNGDALYVESVDYTVDLVDHKTYEFDLSVPVTLEDGPWKVQMYLLLDGIWYVSTLTDWGNSLAATEDASILIDKIEPVVSSVALDGAVYGDHTETLSGIDYFSEGERFVWPNVSTLKGDRQSSLLSRKQKNKDKKEGVVGFADKKIVRGNKIKKWNHKVGVLESKELLRTSFSSGASEILVIDLGIDDLIYGTNQLNQLAGEINSLTGQLGIPVLSGSLYSATGLDHFTNLTAIDTGPPLPIGGGAGYTCPFGVGGSSFNAGSLTGCVDTLDTAIGALTTQIAVKDAAIRIKAGRFKKEAIETEMVCDDLSAGCFPYCNPADASCDIDCSVNQRACDLYKTIDLVSYNANCSGVPEVCEVDCTLSPSVCRRGTFDFEVKGNFCDDAEFCNTTGVNDFEVCDNVGNCTILNTSGVETDWYDPVAPSLTASHLIRNKDNVGGTETFIDGQGGGDVLSASDRFTFDITANDPKKPTSIQYPALIKSDACGGGGDAFFRADVLDTHCSQSKVSCALSSNVRGVIDREQGGACSGLCPEGYLLDVNNYCVPQCDYRLFDGCFPFFLIGESCKSDIWLPVDSAMIIGQPFIQTSNCGKTRNAVGTKPLTTSIKHFLDGEDAFGVFFYDTFEDSQSFSQIVYAPSFAINTAGFGGVTSSGLVNATFSHESGFSPEGGNVLKIESGNVLGGFGAWEQTSIAVDPSTDYILSYWVKTNSVTNKNAQGAWARLVGSGGQDIASQYMATMKGVPGDLSWYKVDIHFATPAGVNNVDLQLRLEAQNDKVAYFDGIKIFEKNWRYDSSKSWYTESLDDTVDGVCDYMTGDGDGDPRGGLDDRCGSQSFPEKVVIAFTSNGMYVFDVINGALWLSALQAPDPLDWGRQVFNELLFGDSYGLNGKLYSTFRFNQGGGKNGAVIVGDLIGDTIYSHRMSNCFTLSGHKGSGSSFSTYFPAGCGQHAYNWVGFVDDKTSTRNVPAYPWSTVMPNNLQIATNQVNSMHTQIVGGKTYVAVATNFGVTILNKTDDTNQHIEIDGLDSSNYVWSHTPANANIYRKVYIDKTGKLYYLWDYNGSTRARIWVIDDVTILPFNSAILSGVATWDSIIQPNNALSSYPVTALPETADSLDVSGDEFLVGSMAGFERFKGSFSSGSEHDNLFRTRIMKLFAGAPLYGKVLGHWVSGLQDIGGKANDLASTGTVTVSGVDFGTDLQQFNFNETGHLSSISNDFDASGELTIGVWVKTTPALDDGGYIIAKKDDSNTDYALYRDANDKLRSEGSAHTLIDFTLDGWNFVVVSWNGTNKKTYIDGQLVSVVVDAKNDFSSVSEFRLGDRFGTTSTATKLSGSIALPFVVNNAYSLQQVKGVYNGTRDWFEEGVKITIQGVSDNVEDVAYGDGGTYFVATPEGITHFDLSGRVIRTVSAAVTSLTNVHIASNDIRSISYRNGWLIIAYNGRGVEIVNIALDTKEFFPKFDSSLYDPYYFY